MSISFFFPFLARTTCARKHINLIANYLLGLLPTATHFEGHFGIFGKKPFDFLCKWSKWQNATRCCWCYYCRCLNKHLSAPRQLFRCRCRPLFQSLGWLSTSVSVRVFQFFFPPSSSLSSSSILEAVS